MSFAARSKSDSVRAVIRPWVVVSRSQKNPDSSGSESFDLGYQEAFGRPRQPVVVEEVPGDEQGVSLSLQAHINHPLECMPARFTKPAPGILGPAPVGRVEVHVGTVDESEVLGHGLRFFRRASLPH